MVLEAIKYSRGQLALLEQRKLPQETEWIDIRNTEDGWKAIREMTVRGAPAIAISGALSLAVELVREGNGSQFESAKSAEEHVKERLQYLETSRPTAVNLFIATKQLRDLVEAEVEKGGATGESVVHVVVTAAEEMLAEDVRSNRIMGNYGAEAMLAAVNARGRGQSGKLRVLTHCNTGSLATAAYGTALGVVRALHENGQLEHVYCTETRPYNQGARLTAFEIATDNMPGTLICDSAVAALMQSNKVDAVVVGADRIAANGDTANKIGTFNIAVAAAYHNIPFFVAAPTTTIDVELKSGVLIPIEQRSSEEITHFRGIRVAADLPVWNPSFDVTPSSLIEGIITERGMAPRSGPQASFLLSQWLRGQDKKVSSFSADESLDLVRPETEFKELSFQSAVDYVMSRPHLSIHVGDVSTSSSWSVREIGDGNLNYVFIVEGPDGAVCIKQAPPFVRIIGSGWPLPQDRCRIEADALVEQGRACAAHIPAVLHFDENDHILVMQYIEPPHITLRRGLIEGLTYPCLAKDMVSFLSRTLFKNSYLSMDLESFRNMCSRFTNKELCSLTEQVIFTDPYYGAKDNRHTTPHLDADVKEIQTNPKLLLEAMRMKAIFVEKKEALVHGDLHTGSVMVTDKSTFVIDPEFAFVGPVGFDVGKFIANLLLAYFAAEGHARQDGKDRKNQQDWLLKMVEEIWHGFTREFCSMWEESKIEKSLFDPRLFVESCQGSEFVSSMLMEDFLKSLWRDALGFAGCVLIRRIVGVAHVADLEEIQNADTRASCERKCLHLAKILLLERESTLPDIESVTKLASSL